MSSLFWHFVHHVYLVIRQKSSVSVIPPSMSWQKVSPWPHLIIWYLFLAQAAIFISTPANSLFCPCVPTDRDKHSGYFLKRKAPKRTRPKPEFRESCSWMLFGRGTLELVWILFRTDYEIWSDIWTQRRGLNEIRLTLANWFHNVVALFVSTSKIYSS